MNVCVFLSHKKRRVGAEMGDKGGMQSALTASTAVCSDAL